MRVSCVAILLVGLLSASTHAWGELPDGELLDKQARKQARIEARAARKAARKKAREERKAARQEAKAARQEWKQKIQELLERGFDETDEAYMEDGAKIYQELKIATKSLLIGPVQLFLPKDLAPEIKWYNTAALPGTCDQPGFQSVHDRFKALFNGILKSRDFEPVDFKVVSSSSDFVRDHARNLRGSEGDRELYSSYGCSGYLCAWYGTGRRRLENADEDLPLIQDAGTEVASFGEAEMQLRELKIAIEQQCQHLLAVVARTDAVIKTTECREAIAASICEVTIPVWENVDIGEEAE